MMGRPSLDSLSSFAAVARTRSFTRAAAELRVSTSALSHTIRELEARLGIRLLQRNSRSVSVTQAGERLLQTLGPALADITGALEELNRERDLVSGSVRITATRNAFETVIGPMLPGFLAAHPRAHVEVLIDYQLRDIIAERFDAGIRIGEKLEQDMIAVPVGPALRMAIVASPSYVDAHGAPRTPQDLVGHLCVNYRMMASGQTLDWEFERDGRALAIKVTGPLTYNEPEMMIEAAVDGLGVAYVLEDQAKPHLVAGRLVRLLEDWMAPFPGYFLYYPSRRQMPPVLSALVAALRRSR
ncbi:LysR family transcriptional regulator [Acidisoma sp.]|uniref:LysR family transcriptional regulator n=1 Tax=Acidisoma sp. TaxID=1872115 RepID=UPI003B005AD6